QPMDGAYRRAAVTLFGWPRPDRHWQHSPLSCRGIQYSNWLLHRGRFALDTRTDLPVFCVRQACNLGVVVISTDIRSQPLWVTLLLDFPNERREFDLGGFGLFAERESSLGLKRKAIGA